MPGLTFESISSKDHQVHIKLSEPLTGIVQQGSSLGLNQTSASFNPHYNPTFGSLTLCQVLSGRRQRQINRKISVSPSQLKVNDRFEAEWLLVSAGLYSRERWCHWQALSWFCTNICSVSNCNFQVHIVCRLVCFLCSMAYQRSGVISRQSYPLIYFNP